jgi:hypothetical protein
MNTLTAQPEDELDDPSDEQLPGRPRHKLLNRITVPLLVLLVTRERAASRRPGSARAEVPRAVASGVDRVPAARRRARSARSPAGRST